MAAPPAHFKYVSHNMGEEEVSEECGNVVLWSIWQGPVISLLESPPPGIVAPLEVSEDGVDRIKDV